MMLIPLLIGILSLSIPSIEALQCSVGTSIPNGSGGVIKQVMSQTCATQCYSTYTKLQGIAIGSIVGGCATGDACSLANDGPVYFANQWVEVKCCNSGDNCNSQDWDAGQYDWNKITMPPPTMEPTQQPQTTSIPTSNDQPNPTINPTSTPTKGALGGNPTPSATSSPPTSRFPVFNSANSLFMSPLVLVVVIGLSLIL